MNKPGWLVVSWVAAGCGGASPMQVAGGPGAHAVERDASPGDGSATEGDAPLFYGPCPTSFASECAYVPLPLYWSQPDRGTIDVMVAHRPAATKPEAQLWLLAGGPGESGEAFAPLLSPLANLLPAAEIFVLEHRGVGESERLGCPAPVASQPAQSLSDQWRVCADALKTTWGDGLGQFNTSNAARDLHALISRTRVPGRPVVLVGVSYGTYLALRFLELFPRSEDGADAVFLDSLVAPGVTLMSQYDAWSDLAGQRLARLCAADPVCGAKMGADPWQKLVSAVASPCPAAGLSRAAMSATMAIMIQARSLMGAVFPFAYRSARCTPEDAAAIGYLAGTVAQLVTDSPASPRESGVLKMQVALSELWEQPRPTAAALASRCDEAAICPGFGPVAAAVDAVWPRYDEPLAGAWPTTSVPILAVHGELDARAPLADAQEIGNHLNGPNQRFVAVPNSLHSVVLSSPLSSGGTCGLEMLRSFVQSTGTAIDTTCLTDVLPVNLAATALGPALFNRPDAWDNSSDSPTPQK